MIPPEVGSWIISRQIAGSLKQRRFLQKDNDLAKASQTDKEIGDVKDSKAGSGDASKSNVTKTDSKESSGQDSDSKIASESIKDSDKTDVAGTGSSMDFPTTIDQVVEALIESDSNTSDKEQDEVDVYNLVDCRQVVSEN